MIAGIDTAQKEQQLKEILALQAMLQQIPKRKKFLDSLLKQKITSPATSNNSFKQREYSLNRYNEKLIKSKIVNNKKEPHILHLTNAGLTRFPLFIFKKNPQYWQNLTTINCKLNNFYYFPTWGQLKHYCPALQEIHYDGDVNDLLFPKLPKKDNPTLEELADSLNNITLSNNAGSILPIGFGRPPAPAIPFDNTPSPKQPITFLWKIKDSSLHLDVKTSDKQILAIAQDKTESNNNIKALEGNPTRQQSNGYR